MKNPDHVDVEWEVLGLLIGMAIGWSIIAGSFIAYAIWYLHR